MYKDPLAVEQNNYLTKIVNVYLVYVVDAWPRNPTNHFKFKKHLFGATSIFKVATHFSEKKIKVIQGYI